MADALGDRLDQLDLAVEEGPAVPLGRRLSVGNENPAQDRVVNPDVGAQDVRSLLEVGGGVDLGTVLDLGLAGVGELPAGGMTLITRRKTSSKERWKLLRISSTL